MGAVTHPEPAVAADVAANFVPVKLKSADHADLARSFGVRWLPATIVADAQGKAQHMTLGFLPPAHYRAELCFGRAMAAFGAKEYEGAKRLFAELAEKHPKTERTAEGHYWTGVTLLRQTRDFLKCKEAWRRIPKEFPGSLWAAKVEWALE